jgi:hypothetical protein
MCTYIGRDWGVTGMSRHRGLLAVIAGVLVLAGLGIGLAVGQGNSSSAGSATAKAAASFTVKQRARLEQGITAPAVTMQAGIVAPEVRGQFQQLGKVLLPPGSRLSIDTATFRAVSGQLATVTATVTGPDRGTWQLVLIREDGQWLLLGTRKLS